LSFNNSDENKKEDDYFKVVVTNPKGIFQLPGIVTPPRAAKPYNERRLLK